MMTLTKPKVPCLCGCNRGPVADEARKARKAAAERKRAIDHAAFDLFYADLKAGRTLMAPADYIAIAGDNLAGVEV